MPILKVSNVLLAANSITASMIQDLVVNTADLADNAITASKITDNTITNAKLAVSTIDSTRLASNIDLSEKGSYLVLPRGTTNLRPAGVAPGMIRFNTTGNVAEIYQSNTWTPVSGGATGGVGNFVFYENDANVTADYTVTTGKNAMSAGPITILANVTVTVPGGSYWTVI